MAAQTNGEQNTIARKSKRSSYIFTNKSYSPKSIMSTILGVLSMVGIILSIVFTFQRRGEALLQYGAVLLLCTIFSLIGLILAFWAKMERDKYYLFAYLGLLFNLMDLIGMSLILYAGAYGI